ncbi:GAF domain-containing protein [Aliikangiella marina]|uniref:GAF domain-containing protein n=1 Tax=Aliikangiella marina TaxID=1712262 RepID=A0A545T4D2_9GAMM|nr:GAF domain-containing protein [Aliikangiella marina]TQV72081.1 GAF domain-containing protein [Aliikangiella marina]
MSEINISQQVIRRLNQINQARAQGFDYQLIELLKLGLQRFNLDIGILSRIEDKLYTVVNCVTPEGVEMKPGDTFDFDITYCEITCGADKPVALEHVGNDDKYGTHPAYSSFGLESYIGIPIRVEGELYGTLNFSSAMPYPRKFSDFDIDALVLMASWLEGELLRQRLEKKLDQLTKELAHSN